MKNIILVAVLSVFVFISCNNTQSGTHTHEDGSQHSECDHEHSGGEAHEQEAFEVGADSTHDCTHDTIAKECEDKHEHAHSDGSVHEH